MHLPRLCLALMLLIPAAQGVWAAPPPEPGTLLPEWSLQTSDGRAVSSASLRGKPVLMLFWATWCPYCRTLMPGIQRIHEEYGPQGLMVLAMNIREDADPVAHMRERGFTFTLLPNADPVANRFGVPGTPTTLFVDGEGRLVYRTHASQPDDPMLWKAARLMVSEPR